jgi:thioredoxin-like negative regulator of GroEL
VKTFAAALCSMMLALVALPAPSAEVPFDQAQFDSMRAAGKPVAVVFHADWCPTCRAQAPVLEKLTRAPAFRSLTLYVANFDTEKALKRSLGVTEQSTIVVFKDGKEVARSTGDTQEQNLSSLLSRAGS